MNNRKTFITFGVVLVSVLGSAFPAYAQDIELSINGNSQKSDNTVTITSESSTTIEQNNTSHIENNVETDVNTGNNTASDNDGDTTITTGDTHVSTEIVNEQINQNNTQIHNSGSANATAVINNNGHNSQNTVTFNQTQNTVINQNNTANITNNVTTKANTGYNSANDNTGNVTIRTGKITAQTTIENKRINNSVAKVNGLNCDGSCNTNNNVLLKIFGNGRGSINNIDFEIDDSTTFDSTNLATIYNDIVHKLNTGGNNANDNTGDVAIITGDIKSDVTVINKDINSNYAEKDCDCEKKPEKPEQPTNPPTKPTPTNGGNGHIGGGNPPPPPGDILGAAVGEILPATGNLFLLWATIASLIMFFSGWYLRFRSGLAPGY